MLRAALLAAAVVVAGCASTGPATSPSPRLGDRPAAPAGPAVAPVLAQEQRWLAQWFDGTPVVVAPGEDGALEVDVPLEFSFDAGKSAVKPPLAAVLDKLALSLARQQTARVQVSAPAEGARADVLSRERAAKVRDYLQAKGVQSRRIEPVSVANGSTVALRMVPGPVAIERLEDAPPGAGRRVTPPPKPAR
jgi:outer membrane protein OmpA-like peptidoglycan-associated protein